MRDTNRQKGNAAVELGLMFPIALALMMLAVEGGFALKAYMALHEASREGARLVLRESSAAQLPLALKTLADKLDLTKLKSTVVMDQGTKSVSVELTYDYPTFFGKYASGSSGNWDPRDMTSGGLISGAISGSWQETVIEVDYDTRKHIYVFAASDGKVSGHTTGVAESNSGGFGFGMDSLLLKAKTVMPLP